MGTVNDFGRALHLPNDIMGAVDIIIEGHTTKVDIGKMNNRYFINLAEEVDSLKSLMRRQVNLNLLLDLLHITLKGLKCYHK